MAEKTQHKKPVNLALQGGGAHGAFTWGVLDELLCDDRLEIEAITGTSAGAMNAVVIAQGLLTGGRKEARRLLREFWHKVSSAASMFPLQPTMLDKVLGNDNLHYSPGFMAMDMMTRVLSPYQYNFLDINPLRSIIEEMVDFELLRANKKIQLFVNATNVRNGKIRVFRAPELTLDMVMASACLPFLYKAVEVDGEHYWDGGYSGNPALYPLYYHCTSSDIILVQINPVHVDAVPTHANDILDRVNEISFNSNLMGEMRSIQFVQKLLQHNNVPEERYKAVHMHMITAEETMAGLGASSKLNADWNFMTHLSDVGMQSAQEWLDDNFDAIGQKSSVDVEAVYL